MTVQSLQTISFVFQECAFQPQGCSGLFYCENSAIRGVLAFENVALNNEETVSVMRGRHQRQTHKTTRPDLLAQAKFAWSHACRHDKCQWMDIDDTFRHSDQHLQHHLACVSLAPYLVGLLLEVSLCQKFDEYSLTL